MIDKPTRNYKITTNVTKKNNAIVELEITIDKSEIQHEFNKTLKDINKKVQLPGFRPGKAPLNVIKKKFLPNINYSVISELLPKVVRQALNQNEINAFGESEFDDIEGIKENEDFTFTTRMEVAPSIELGKYKGLSVKKTVYSYDKKIVQEYMEQAREAQTNLKPKEDGEVEENDVCLLEFAYYLDEFDETLKRSAMLEINDKDEYFKDYYKNFIGMKKDEEKTLDLKIPEYFPEEDLAGKDGHLWIKVINISAKDTPELDDEFAKDLGFDNLNQYKLDVEKKLEKRCRAKERDELADTITDKIIEESTFDIPKSLIDQQTQQVLQNLHYYLARTGLSFEQYLESEDKSYKEFMNEQSKKAEKMIKRHLIISEIEKLENIEITDDDINAYLTEHAEDNEASLNKLKSDYEQPEVKQAVDSQVKNNKVIDFIIENSKVSKGEKKKLEV